MPTKYSYTVGTNGKPYFYELKAGKKVRVGAKDVPAKVRSDAAKVSKERKTMKVPKTIFDVKREKSASSKHTRKMKVCTNMKAQLNYMQKSLANLDVSNVRRSGECVTLKTTTKGVNDVKRLAKARMGSFGVRAKNEDTKAEYKITYMSKK